MRSPATWEPVRAATKAFVAAVGAGDSVALSDAFKQLSRTHYWGAAFRALVRAQPECPRHIRQDFVGVVARHGDSIRDRVDHRTLVEAYRLLLPLYAGPPVRLYRGDGARNRRRRTYGLSWTDDREVAEGFATWLWQTCEGGSVLIETLAPPAAIICAVHEYDDSYGEREYLLDRRLLTGVTVIARFPQIPPGLIDEG